jgi:branched-chain amino acid transport system substrate-binding protein
MSSANISRRALLGAAALGSLAACARPVDPGTGGTNPKRTLNVGLLVTGHVAESTRFEAGLRNGLLWGTSRTNKIGVRRINMPQADDRNDPAVAEAAAEDLIKRGCQLLVGGVSSAVALRVAQVAARRKVLYIAGTANADELSGINEYTFRSGCQVTQELLAAKTLVKPGKRLVVLASGKSAAGRVLGAATTLAGRKDLTRRLAAARADQLFVDWPGADAALWAALPKGLETISVLGARATWPAYGSAGASIKFVTPYVDGASDNNAYIALRNAVPMKRTDTGHVEGFAAGQMIVRALQTGPENPAEMIKALEGYHFGGVKGDLLVRPEDHCLLQPQWAADLTWTGAAGALTADATTVIQASTTAPPL